VERGEEPPAHSPQNWATVGIKSSCDYPQRSECNTLFSLAGGNVRDYAIFQVFLQTGVRVSEQVNLGH
jgi:hypothetical protein